MLAPHFDAEGRLSGWDGVVTEVTEQRALAVDLRRTTSMFQALVANLPAGVFFVQGPTGHPILVNNRARQLLGRREEPAAGLERLSQVYHLHRSDGSPYPVEELPVFQALRRGATAMRDDIVVHQADGRRVPLVTWAAPVRLDGRGPTDAAVWVLEDLTALHKAEAARRDTEGRLRTVVETMGEGLIVQDRNQVVVDCNAAACACSGARRSRCGRRRCAVLVLAARGRLRPARRRTPGPGGAAHGPAGAELHAGAAAGRGRPGAALAPRQRHAADRRRRDGRRGDDPVRRHGLPPRPGGFAPVGGEISRADRGDAADAGAGRPGDARRVRQPGRAPVTGFEIEEIAAPSAWAHFIHPDDLPRVNAAAIEALAGRPSRMEYRYNAKDGSVKTAFAMIQPRRQGGAVIGTTALMVDVTRKRQLEQDLQRSQRLELIGRLSSGVAHDFNNLLTVVLSLTDVAHGSLPPDHPAHGDLRRIAATGEQAASLAGQLLAFSRLQRTTARRAEVNKAARRTLDLLYGALPPAVRVEASLGDGELLVPIDETQLQQVLMNLCLNARDAMPDGGRLRVWAETVADPGDSTAPWVRLAVADDGCGIPDEVKSRIFEPFFSTKERGTGLGLAVVRQIVEGGGGRVEVQSEPGRGSRFEVWLPTQPAAVAPAVAEAADAVASGI